MKKYFVSKRNNGFTLIELVIVIAIIAVIGASVITLIDPFEIQKSARDSVRVSILNSMSQALELYFSINKKYPSNLTDNLIQTNLKQLNSTIVFFDDTNCRLFYQKTNVGYFLLLPKESKSFTIPSGQSLVSIQNASDFGYGCENLTFNQVIKLEVK
jgi:prepilin-type N-terminal cleavage/methylation domain-containing protein